MIPEERLIKKVLAGNVQATRMLIERYKHHVFKVSMSVMRDEKLAEDVAQETFLKMLAALPSYQGPGFRTWISRIAYRKALDEKRKMKRRPEEPVEWDFDRESSGQISPESQLFKKESKESIYQAINQLPENYREVVEAYYIDELSYKEMGKKLGLAEKTVEMKLYRARKWMKKHWKEDDFI
ncbi:RNA polymerase sigma factor [Halobacillus sp. Marseille-Q1614]|uniref:RNA polymerase sigma factor n=1 Tax=Halobacillus sp. Marseille-Q1614 TaxID=2709134 RepID=UPI00156D5CF8|nr:sigma-70 family RNA polymerase sigma factor [Halobacillus sp. Marseille-Q1614]